MLTALAAGLAIRHGSYTPYHPSVVLTTYVPNIHLDVIHIFPSRSSYYALSKKFPSHLVCISCVPLPSHMHAHLHSWKFNITRFISLDLYFVGVIDLLTSRLLLCID